MRVSSHVQSFCLVFVHVLYFTNADQAKDVSDDDLNFDLDPNDFLDSLTSMADMLTDYAGDESGCQYSCKSGIIPKPRPNHKQRSNGCGSFGLELDTSSVPGVTQCCDKHDICYDTCNMDKITCDQDFRDCLYEVCHNYRKTADDKDDVVSSCYSTAELMYTTTMTLGCKPYKDSQKDACICDKDEL